MPWLHEVKAAHERRTKISLIDLLTVVHTADPKALAQKLLADLDPAAVVHPFDRLMAEARRDLAARDARD